VTVGFFRLPVTFGGATVDVEAPRIGWRATVAGGADPAGAGGAAPAVPDAADVLTGLPPNQNLSSFS